MEKLTAFVAQHAASIQYVTPSSPEYAEIRSGYIINPSLNPPGIICPQSVDEVAMVASFMIEHDIQFTIRVGGHDLFSRTFKSDAVTLDLRKLNHVHVDPQGLTARVGGGTLTSDLARVLGEHGFVAPCPTVPSVGYVGWATHGGYGSYTTNFGLGVDQILAAKVIDRQGKVIEADAELLKGIRGAGGAFGIIVELTIPVFPLEKVFAGLVTFGPGDITAIIRQFNEGYSQLSEHFPAPLGIQQGVLNPPSGPTLALFFAWSSNDTVEGEKWLAKITSLAPLATSNVQWISPATWLDVVNTLVPKRVSGRMWSVIFKELTDEVLDVICAHVEKITPDPHVMMTIHELRGPSAILKENSVFSARTPHHMIEILTIPPSPENLEAALTWGREFRDALARTSSENILPETYMALTAPDELDMAKMYGKHWPFLQELKRARDPLNVFRNALAQF